MDFPENESVVSVSTDWSEDVEMRYSEDLDMPFQIKPQQTLLQELLCKDIQENPSLKYDSWLILFQEKNTSLHSLRWMEELSQASTEKLEYDVFSFIQDAFDESLG